MPSMHACHGYGGYEKNFGLLNFSSSFSSFDDNKLSSNGNEYLPLDGIFSSRPNTYVPELIPIISNKHGKNTTFVGEIDIIIVGCECAPIAFRFFFEQQFIVYECEVLNKETSCKCC
jgi:hypothetical protein